LGPEMPAKGKGNRAVHTHTHTHTHTITMFNATAALYSTIYYSTRQINNLMNR